MDVKEIIFTFLGGLAIFLFSIKYMGDGLQKAAGDRLREILDKFTNNPIKGVLAGIIVTGLIQSSSGTTVLTVGLVNAGFLNLRQAIGIIMGANIGTTFTAFMLGLKLTDYALPVMAIGAFLIFFIKNKRAVNFGQVFFGLGGLFYGLELMGDAMKPLRDLDIFVDLTVSMSDHPLLGVLVGTVITMIIQSSTATIALLQQLFEQGAIGELSAALPVLFGDNIGTTITTVLASIGATVAARRAALTHVLFNVIGTTLVLLILGPFTSFIAFLAETWSLNPKMTIAFAHGIFNVSNVIIQLPFIGGLAWIVTKLVPGDDTVIEYKAQHLDPVLIEQSSAIALGQSKKEVVRMAELAEKGLLETLQFVKTKQKRHAELAYQFEEAINNLDRKITEYLVQISSNSLSSQDSEVHSVLMSTVRDIERMGDHMENIIELTEFQVANRVKMSDLAMQDLDDMFQLTLETVKESFEALEKHDIELAKDVVLKEEKIDKMERQLRKKHIIRLNEGKCEPSAGIVFVDIISNLERIGDHAVNIAETVIGEE